MPRFSDASAVQVGSASASAVYAGANLVWSATPSTTPAFGSFSSATPGTVATSVTVNVPSGTTNGDLLLLNVSTGSGDAFTTPTGWTLLNSELTLQVSSALYYRVASSEPASYTVTVADADAMLGAILRYTGYTAIRDHQKAGHSSSDSATSTTPAALTGVQSTDRVIQLFAPGETSPISSAPTLTAPGAPWTTRVNTATGAAGGYQVGLVAVDAVGSTATPTASSTRSTTRWAVFSIAIH